MQASEANQLMLASAYQEQGRFEEAEALLRVMRMQRPLSVEVLTMSAGMQAAWPLRWGRRLLQTGDRHPGRHRAGVGGAAAALGADDGSQ